MSSRDIETCTTIALSLRNEYPVKHTLRGVQVVRWLAASYDMRGLDGPIVHFTTSPSQRDAEVEIVVLLDGDGGPVGGMVYVGNYQMDDYGKLAHVFARATMAGAFSDAPA